MTGVTQEDRENAVYVLPAGYSEDEFETSVDEQAFNAFKDEAHDNDNYSKITVSRVPMNRTGQRGSQKLHFLFECAVEEYTFTQLLGKLRDEYKSGFYKIQARNEKGQLKLNKTVAVEAPHADTANAIGDGGTGAIIEQFSRSLAEQNTETREMLQSLVPAQNPMSSIKDLMEIMATLMGAAGLNPAPQIAPKTLVEQLTEFKMIKELFGGDDEGLAGSGGDANLYSLMTETMKTLGGPIAAAIVAGTESGQLNTQGVAALDAPKPKEAETVTDTEKQDIAMRQNINILIKNAKSKVPPGTFANILVSSTPEADQDKLWDFISAENCVDTIIELEPAAEPYRDWFDELRQAVIELMADPEEKELQEHTGEDSIAELPAKPVNGTVAGAEDTETDSNGGQGDGDTPEHT